MGTLVFATNNAHKVSEVKEILGDQFEIRTLSEVGIFDDIPETAETFQGNALQKARYIHDKLGVDCFADDTGLEVDILGGAPGVHSARYATDGHDFEANKKLLLKNMGDADNRKADFRTVVALILDGKEYLFEGRVDGTITREERGEGGFGYDPLFVPDGYDISFAEMSSGEKNAISHRGRAIQKLAEFLRKWKR